jgi:hypothetical protein
MSAGKIGFSLFLLLHFVPLHAQMADGPYVQLTDGVRVYGKVKIETGFFGGTRIVVDDTVKYDLKAVSRVKTNEGYFAVYEGSLVERIQSGRIELYARYQETYNPGTWHTVSTPGGSMSYYSGGGSVTSRREYISKDDGPIMKASRANLLDALHDNPKSVALVEQYWRLEAVQWLFPIAGLGVIVASAASAKKNQGLPPGIIVGAVIAAGAWIPHAMKQGKIDRAIELYNAENSSDSE